MLFKPKTTLITGAIGAIAGASAVIFDAVHNLHAHIKRHTMYGTAIVFDIYDNSDKPVRLLRVGKTIQSGTYLDEDRFTAPFNYLRAFDAIFEGTADLHTVCMLGGGGYAYPKQLVSTHPEVQLDVVEIDQAITDIAKEYFFLDELIAHCCQDPEGTICEDPSIPARIEDHGNLRIITATGATWLITKPAAYDAIINDAFASDKLPQGLGFFEAARLAKTALTNDGCYLVNLVLKTQGTPEEAALLQSRCNELHAVFEHVCVLPISESGFDGHENYLLIGSDTASEFKGAFAAETNTELHEA